MTRAPVICVALAALAGCGKVQDIDPSQQVGPNPVLPKPAEELVAAVGVPKVVGWQPGQAPSVPAGFHVEAMATGLSNPRNVYPLPNGDILVVESQRVGSEPLERPKDPIRDFIMSLAHGGGGATETAGASGGPPERITLLRDANGDGKPELKTVLLDHLNAPFGVAVVGSDLYVANTDAIIRYPFAAGQTRITARGQKVIDLPGGLIDHHWTKSLTTSPDGTKLYAGVGSNSNIQERGPEAETNRAAVWEVDPKTGAYRVFASGLRNPNGLTFYPGSNTLWTVVNERDELGPNLVPDYMTSVKDGAFYGWPYSYYGQHVDPRVRPQRPDLVARAIPPDYALSSHVAALGLAFYTANSFPAMFHGGAFVGEHGSWNRTQLNGYRVVFIRFASGRPVGRPFNFVTGFLGANGEARGRPVGVAVDRTGALLIADDVGNTVWRVTYTGGKAVA
ncbi:PQQ-dependent sugar dehydrogenase [Sphingomonas sp. URHD0057]|uniref:PQQ-dependent sugar dehydrogenase n=1 Tax=Sphingomonas sp. URHD0057 TaxID=1380389 RepID=UPI000491AE9F|nr:sorbosone dehydrogenase family protein [Sphingomonas sp. URHD0057]